MARQYDKIVYLDYHRKWKIGWLVSTILSGRELSYNIFFCSHPIHEEDEFKCRLPCCVTGINEEQTIVSRALAMKFSDITPPTENTGFVFHDTKLQQAEVLWGNSINSYVTIGGMGHLIYGTVYRMPPEEYKIFNDWF